jgi:NAD-dependent deacetylase
VQIHDDVAELEQTAPRSNATGARYGSFVQYAQEQAREILSAAQRVVVLSGAGISTASGIPDFRGPEGVWTKDPHAEMLSSFDVWVSNKSVREAAWASRVSRRHVKYEANAGHYALNKLVDRAVLELLVTQNIDGLHHASGTPGELIVEIHGCSRDALCLACAHREPIDATLDRVAAGESDPTCLQVVSGELCGGMLKSATISFGQSLVASDLERAQRCAANCDVIVAVGTTLAVYPVAGLVPLAARSGAKVVIVNGAPTSLDELADVVVTGDISETLPELTRF